MRGAGVFHPGFTHADAAGLLAVVPGAWRGRVGRLWEHKREAAKNDGKTGADRFDGFHAADAWLSVTAGRMREIHVPLNISDGELCALADQCARDCQSLAFSVTVTDTARLWEKMAGFVRRYGIEPPEPVTDKETGEVRYPPAIRRMGCGLWWRRRLRVAQGRAIEREAIRLGYVHKNREIYASSLTVERRGQQKRRNAKALADTVAVNQYGDEFTLAELAARAVSNPTIRRGELMTRISGFEAVAKGLEHVGMFFTVTCPSRMHPKKQGNGQVFENPKYDGATPREAARYLSGMWAKCRAALARAGAAVYGFRIAEPHHDATPHWHLLLFMAREVKATVCRVFAKYARAEDADEMSNKAARDARFKAVQIDPERGTAAGYVAKYVSKNIDGGGYQVQGDLEGSGYEAVTPSHRVEAWASTWGIRQFQQIGGAPVGVWRELRRLKESEGLTDTVRAARSAADVGNWARYVEVMGGATVKRKDLPIVIARTRAGERYDADAGECYEAPVTRYGEQAAAAVWGVKDCNKGRAFLTRVYRWEVKGKTNGQDFFGNTKRVTARKGEVPEFDAGGNCFDGRSGGIGESNVGRVSGGYSEGGCAGGSDGYSSGDRGGRYDRELPAWEGVGSRFLGFGFGRESGPWTRVNNCTEVGNDATGKSGNQGAQDARQGAAHDGGNVHAGRGAGGNQRNGRTLSRSGAGGCRSSGSASEFG